MWSNAQFENMSLGTSSCTYMLEQRYYGSTFGILMRYYTSLRSKAVCLSHWLRCSLSRKPFFSVALRTQDFKTTFTWQNGLPRDAFVQERLDRACATTPWQVMFPEERVFHLQVLYSNHDPILLNMQLVTQQHQARKNQHHRFEERWVARLDCENVIREAWS